MKKVKVGIIGGSGLDDPKIIKGAKEKSDSGQGHRAGCGAEVAPAAIDTLGNTDCFGREPLANHANTDYEAGTDETE